MHRVVALSLLAACGRLGFDGETLQDGGVDAPVDGSVDAFVCAEWGDWGPPAMVPELSTASGNELDPAFSSDGLTLVFSIYGQTEFELWSATRPSLTEPFGPPTFLSQSGSGHDCNGALSSDDLELYYGFDRIFRATRNSPSEEFANEQLIAGNDAVHTSPRGVTLRSDGLEMIFSAIPEGESEHRLYRKIRMMPSGGWGASTVLPDINPGMETTYPGISADGLEMIVTFDNPTNLARVRRTSLAFDFDPASFEVMTALNSSEPDADPSISPNGQELFFGSQRGAGGDWDIYRSTRECLQ